MWNAAVALGIDGATLTAPFDTVSLCLSKGLGAPMGSVLSGPAALISEARKYRKMLGGGLRQVGMVAAAGIHALDHHVERLADDHANAAVLAEALDAIDGIEIRAQNTNMVFCTAGQVDPAVLTDAMEAAGVLALWHRLPTARPRLGWSPISTCRAAISNWWRTPSSRPSPTDQIRPATR